MELNRIKKIALLTATAVLSALLTTPSKAWQAQQNSTYTPGTRVCVIHDFASQPGDAATPREPGAIALGPDGLYYSTSSGGGSGAGTIFRFSPDKNNFEVRYPFDKKTFGASPQGGLMFNKDEGAFYGTTSAGGLFGAGVLFKFKPGDVKPTEVHTFRLGKMTGIVPESCPANKTCRPSPQQQMNALAGIPVSAPVLASDGVLYGVTQGAQYGGVLYKVAPYRGESGITALCIGGPMPDRDSEITEQNLRDLCAFNGKQAGSAPFTLTAVSKADVLKNPSLNYLFGTTFNGIGNINGTVFKAEIPSGRVTTLYNFSDPKIGKSPYGVIAASDGHLYGGTSKGGPLYGSGNPADGRGVVYRLSPSGGTPEIIHAFQNVGEGTGAVGGLVEIQSKGQYYLYGSAAEGGVGGGVLFRLLLNMGPLAPGQTFNSYEILHVFSYSTGNLPLSTMVSANDPTYGLTFYGTTTGGNSNYGALFRMRAVDLPPVRNLFTTPRIFPTALTQIYPTATVPIPGQPISARITVKTGMAAASPPQPAQKGISDNGIEIDVLSCRNPHIVQFVYREKIGSNGLPLGGTFTLSDGTSYPFSTGPTPLWRADTSTPPNAYYDQNQGKIYGVPRIAGPFNLTIFDQPNFLAIRMQDITPNSIVNYIEGAQETWRATFKDFVICNCQVIGEINWKREQRWIPDPSFNSVSSNNKGHQDAPQYSVDPIVSSSDLKWSDQELQWINDHLKSDPSAKFNPVP
jgi:uncharacterized repeat protein (TIGR03803 family)